MSNAKRFLSVILSMIMVLSTLVIGASAAYNEYKDSAILGKYDSLDKPHLTTEQYASAAIDEIDRMLAEGGDSMILNVYVLTLDLRSIDHAMDSLYGVKKSSAWNVIKGLIGDLQNLSFDAFKTEAEGGVRRGTPGKSDADIIYAVLQFLYDNRQLLANFVKGNLDIGTLVPSLIPDFDNYTNVNRLLKGLLYKLTYGVEAPSNVETVSIDKMVQDLIDVQVVQLVPALEGHTNISSGTMYNFLDDAIKVLYNELVVPLLNNEAKTAIQELCGVVFVRDEFGNIIDEDRSNLNPYASLINIDFEVPTYKFTSGTVISQLNNLVKSILDVAINPDVFVWQAGSNSVLIDNITNIAKAALVNTGDDFFADYIDVATPEEIEAMSTEELCVYALRAVINGSVNQMYIPEEATTLREFGYYALSQLLATSVPELDFSAMDKNSTDTLIIMGINYAIYSANAAIDLGLEYVYTMEDVDKQINTAVDYAIDNFGGLLNGINFNSSSGWENLNTLIFSIIPANWLPASAKGDAKTFIIDCLIENILNLNFDAIFDMFVYRSDSELQSTPKQVVINLVTRIVNIIFPNAIAPATSIDAVATNAALGETVLKILTNIYSYRVNLVAAILPTLCGILNLTNLQKFEFPEYTYDKMYIGTSGSVQFDIGVRNESTGINTGWTDAKGVFHQDSLYTYDIKSITTSLGTVTASVANKKLAAGQSTKIAVDGSFSADGVLSIDVTYDVLTETGTTMTDTPITETLYLYLTKTESDEDTATDVTSGNIILKDAVSYVYASSINDLFNFTLNIENKGAAATLTPHSTYGNTAALSFLDSTGANYIQRRTETTNILAAQTADGKTYNGTASVKILEASEAYDELTGEQKDAVWEDIISTNSTPRSFPMKSIAFGVKSGATTAQKTIKVFLYNDFGLPGLVNSELNAHRQASDYGASAWATYVTAISNAVKAVYSPFKNTTFATNSAAGKAFNYGPAYEALEAAVEGLEASQQSAGVGVLQEIINKYNPTNDETVEYDDPNYNFFSVSDYVAYTYYNYRDEYRAAKSLIDRATIPNEETGAVEVVSSLTLASTKHRLDLYGSRLLPVTADKRHLAAELANPTRKNIGSASDYTEESWAEYQRAVAFATTINNTAVSSLKQSQVNTAYEKLLETEKKLVAGSTTPPVGDVTFEAVNPEDPSQALQIVETVDGKVLLGMFPDGTYNIEDYFNCTGCYVELDASAALATTGSVVYIKDSSTNAVVDTFVLCVIGDVNSDGTAASASDLVGIFSFIQGISDPNAVQTFASDFNASETVDSADLVTVSSVVQGLKDIDYANRVAV